MFDDIYRGGRARRPPSALGDPEAKSPAASRGSCKPFAVAGRSGKGSRWGKGTGREAGKGRGNLARPGAVPAGTERATRACRSPQRSPKGGEGGEGRPEGRVSPAPQLLHLERENGDGIADGEEASPDARGRGPGSREQGRSESASLEGVAPPAGGGPREVQGRSPSSTEASQTIETVQVGPTTTTGQRTRRRRTTATQPLPRTSARQSRRMQLTRVLAFGRDSANQGEPTAGQQRARRAPPRPAGRNRLRAGTSSRRPGQGANNARGGQGRTPPPRRRRTRAIRSAQASAVLLSKGRTDTDTQAASPSASRSSWTRERPKAIEETITNGPAGNDGTPVSFRSRRQGQGPAHVLIDAPAPGPAEAANPRPGKGHREGLRPVQGTDGPRVPQVRPVRGRSTGWKSSSTSASSNTRRAGQASRRSPSATSASRSRASRPGAGEEVQRPGRRQGQGEKGDGAQNYVPAGHLLRGPPRLKGQAPHSRHGSPQRRTGSPPPTNATSSPSPASRSSPGGVRGGLGPEGIGRSEGLQPGPAGRFYLEHTASHRRGPHGPQGHPRRGAGLARGFPEAQTGGQTATAGRGQRGGDRRRERDDGAGARTPGPGPDVAAERLPPRAERRRRARADGERTPGPSGPPSRTREARRRRRRRPERPPRGSCRRTWTDEDGRSRRNGQGDGPRSLTDPARRTRPKGRRAKAKARAAKAAKRGNAGGVNRRQPALAGFAPPGIVLARSDQAYPLQQTDRPEPEEETQGQAPGSFPNGKASGHHDPDGSGRFKDRYAEAGR